MHHAMTDTVIENEDGEVYANTLCGKPLEVGDTVGGVVDYLYEFFKGEKPINNHMLSCEDCMSIIFD